MTPQAPPTPEPEPDGIAVLKAQFPDPQPYDDYALERYRAYSHYVAHRAQGMPQAQAARLTCETMGHDAPRGLCLRCGLGVDLGQEQEHKDRKRAVERDAWLASRH